MARPWDADVSLTAEAAKARIDRQFPALAPASLEDLGVGWDNTAYAVNGHLVFRFPRRRLAAVLLENELRVLPGLAPHLPLRVTTATHVGRPDAEYPYPFLGYPMIAGTSACRVAWTDEARAGLAGPLARFLRALHAIPADPATRARGPADELGRARLDRRATPLAERLRSLAEPNPGLDVEALVEVVERLRGTPPWDGPTRWVHGDLYARHVLVDDGLRAVGVIDWGDVHLGDPALDLSIAWSLLPPAGRGGFREAYGPIDPATWDRARFRAIHYGAVLVDYGADVGDAALRAAGRYALESAGRGV